MSKRFAHLQIVVLIKYCVGLVTKTHMIIKINNFVSNQFCKNLIVIIDECFFQLPNQSQFGISFQCTFYRLFAEHYEFSIIAINRLNHELRSWFILKFYLSKRVTPHTVNVFLLYAIASFSNSKLFCHMCNVYHLHICRTFLPIHISINSSAVSELPIWKRQSASRFTTIQLHAITDSSFFSERLFEK